MRKTTKTDSVMAALSGRAAPAEPPEEPVTIQVPPHDGRTIEAITAEIVALKAEAGKSIIGIGLRLIEAKAALAHGDWLAWLSDRVDFSEATAQRFMRLAREWSNPATLTDLGASKALKLLALPEPAREAFISAPHVVDGEKKTVQEMSVRELEKAIRERDAAREELERTQAELEQARQDGEGAALAVAEAESRAEEREREKLQKKLADLGRARDEASRNWDAARAENANLSRDNAALRDRVAELEARPTASKPDEAALREAARNAAEEAEKRTLAANKTALEAAQKALDETRKQLDKANAAKNAAESKAIAAEKAKTDAEARASAAESKAPPTEDRAAAKYIMERMGNDLNALAGYLLKAKQAGDTETAEGIKSTMKRWIKGMERVANET